VSEVGFSYAPLTPLSFLDRAAHAFASRTAVVDGEVRLSYAELARRCARLVSALAATGIEPGDRVAALCANSHVMLELHHGAPARGAALVSVNTRLAQDEMRFVVEHSGARLVVATHEFAERAHWLGGELNIPVYVAGGTDDQYEAWLPTVADPQDRVEPSELDLIAINYTSGTTGQPKGVMYHHRGAYLQALAMAYHARLEPSSAYLWTLPMFHCNGWCFTWALAAAGGTHVCLRRLDTAEVWRLLRDEGVTHFSAAPTVLTMIAEDAGAAPLTSRVNVHSGGAPPTPALLRRIEALGMDVTHLYGLTETFGPVAVNVWQPEWDRVDRDAAALLLARQGIGNITAPSLRVVDDAGLDVPADGETIGEVAVNGNAVMLGYYRDEAATAVATSGGVFRTGDLAVMYQDGYLEIRDRAKDVIISGGENIASVEVERAIDAHPDVIESAVVGMPDAKWGEVPAAFICLRGGSSLSPDELTSFLRDRIAGFKIPKQIHYTVLPRTSTGKIRKDELRARLP
jgi:fatty-acyl-CoA synthase